MSKDPYSFECQQCGNCCRGQGYVYLNQQEIQRMAKFLSLNFLDFQLKYAVTNEGRRVLKSHLNEDCIFLKDNLCMVNEVKPDQCKRWPFWPELFRSKIVFEDAKSFCEGLKEFEFEDFSNCVKSPTSIRFEV